MRRVTYSMGVSLDGYIAGPDGGIDWAEPDEDVFRFAIDEIRQVGVHLLGRRLYETMLYWETAGQDQSLSASEREWAELWNPLPKVVFSRTLTEVRGNARLASGSLAAAASVLSSGRAPGGPGTGRDPHLQVGARLPPPPRGALSVLRTAREDIGPVTVFRRRGEATIRSEGKGVILGRDLGLAEMACRVTVSVLATLKNVPLTAFPSGIALCYQRV